MNKQNDYSLTVHIPFSMCEREAFENYVRENALKTNQLVKRLLINELSTKGTINSLEFTVPKIEESLIKSKR